MEPTLVIIGVNSATAPRSLTEKFNQAGIPPQEALLELVRSGGISEALVLNTCDRLELVMWASDASTAANSALRFLSAHYNLRLDDWSHFYRLLGLNAVKHVIAAISNLGPHRTGECDVAQALLAALDASRNCAAAGAQLTAITSHAMAAAAKLSGCAPAMASTRMACAAIRLTALALGRLEGLAALVVGKRNLGLLVGECLRRHGTRVVRIEEFEAGQAESCEVFTEVATRADILVTCADVRQPWISREWLEQVAARRGGGKFICIDLGTPPNIAPAAKQLQGISLLDMGHIAALATQADEQWQQLQEDAILEHEAAALASKFGFPAMLEQPGRLPRSRMASH